jgi:bifunctional enzyme CysN/CysC
MATGDAAAQIWSRTCYGVMFMPETPLLVAAPAATHTPPATAAAVPIVITGHVDHGKSTIIGRLLADTGSLPIGKLEAVRSKCERNAKPFEYAFLLDALKDEQEQGITIDSARVFFKSASRHYIIIDAPGHVEFLKNMVTGAARAQAALLVIDAREGIRDNSRRHGHLLSMLGIRQIAVLVNKMDLVGYDRNVFHRLTSEYLEFLEGIGVTPVNVIPVSGYNGENVVTKAPTMDWYDGPTVIEALDGFVAAEPAVQQPLRMPVQGVYKFAAQNDDRRIVAGTIHAGRIDAGDEVVFYPSGKHGRVRTIEAFNRPSLNHASAGQATGFTLHEQIYVTRGEIATRRNDRPPLVGTRIRVNLFWLGTSPFVREKKYLLKLGSARVPVQLEAVHRVMDAALLEAAESRQVVARNEVADCALCLGQPLAFDRAGDCELTGRFVIVDNFDISGGGIIQDAVADGQAGLRDAVIRRNLKWAAGGVSLERRAERTSQRPALLLITGEREVDRKAVARELEARLFDDGRFVYFLAIGNILYGVDADLDRSDENRAEHFRRLGEVANILLDAGLIVIVTAVAVTGREVEQLRTAIGQQRLATVWVGERSTTDMEPDLVLTEQGGSEPMKALLQDMGVIFKP